MRTISNMKVDIVQNPSLVSYKENAFRKIFGYRSSRLRPDNFIMKPLN